MRRTDAEFDEAKALPSRGLSGYAVARLTGIPRSTVHYWSRQSRRARPWRPADPDWRPLDSERYCYALGLYLGDGCVTLSKRSAFVTITLDKRYEGIIDEAVTALEAEFPATPVHRYGHRRGCVIVQMNHFSLPFAFPQHGRGRKHLRSIELIPWQLELTRSHPQALLRVWSTPTARGASTDFTQSYPGRVAHYEYPRCELLGIRWTQSNARNISVSHRDSVALLDSFLGPKR